MNTQTIPNAEHDLQPIPDWPAQRASSSVAMKEAPMTHRIDWTTVYAALSEPFEASLIRYRAGATNRDKTQAQALPYVDPRAYEDRLNQLVPGNWEVTFEPWGNDRIICCLTIHGVTRSSTGEASDSPDGIAGTSAEAQAFKRACAKFGLGRHLYATSPRWMPYDQASRSLVIATRESHTLHPTAEASATLGERRAEQMRRLLGDRGYSDDEIARLVRLTSKRGVKALADLTEPEARSVWALATAARRAPNARAQHRAPCVT